MPLTTIWITDTGNSLMQSLRPTPMYIRRGRISAVGRRGTWVVLVRLCLLLAIGASILSGCAGLRLPAIDPTGNRIFLPAPSYTTLVDPADRPFLNPGSLFPEPAFPQPEDPPYCEDMVMVPAAPQVLVPAAPQAQSVVPANAVALEPFEDRERLIDRIRDQWSHRDLYDGKLSLTPARLVAPVGSEVVLRAEICLPDGYNVTREPIEWTLSQDSVGQFVEVDRSGKPLIHTLFHRRPKKVGSNFAIGTTATSSQLITRGTTREDDDIQLLPGQTWISLTSATEGASTVYAVAPRGCDWNNRRQAATIHWVDGQWTFPAPSVGVATAGQNLTTTVTRASNGSPIAGWIVRYEILDGPPAHFESSGNAIAEATSDSLGQATVRIIPDQQSAGTNRVGIQVIRTGSNSGDLARIAVGQGTTSVTWSATGLSVLMRAPDIAEVGSLIDYTIDVTNPSPLPLSDVEVNSAMATELEYVQSDPPGDILGNNVRWLIGPLGPQETRRVAVRMRVSQPTAEFRSCATARDGSGAVAEGCARTRIVATAPPPITGPVIPSVPTTPTVPGKPQVVLQLDGPIRDGVLLDAYSTVHVNDVVRYVITVTNRSAVPISNLMIYDQFDQGLQHNIADGEIKREIPYLAPGQSTQAAVTFRVIAPGQSCHKVEIAVEERIVANAQHCLQAIAASTGPATPMPPQDPPIQIPGNGGAVQPQSRASLWVRTTGPGEAQVGREADFAIEIGNDGEVPLTQVQIQYNIDDNLQLIGMSDTTGFQQDNNLLTGLVPRLEVNETRTFRIGCKGLRPATTACNEVSITCDQGVFKTDRVCVAVTPANPADIDSLQPNAMTLPPEAATQSEVRLRPAVVDEAQGRTDATADSPLQVHVTPGAAHLKRGHQGAYFVEIVNNGEAPQRNVVLELLLPEGSRYLRALAPPRIEPATISNSGRLIVFSPVGVLRTKERVIYEITLEGLASGRGELTTTVRSDQKPVGMQQTTPVMIFED